MSRAYDVALALLFATSSLLSLYLFSARRITAVALAANPSEISLGEVRQDEAVPFDFLLENRTSQPLAIAEVARPCVCTWLDVSTPLVLRPGDSFHVKGTVDTRSRRGTFETAIAVTYQVESDAPEFTLPIPVRMSVKPTVWASPASLSLDCATWTSVDLSQADASPFRLTGVEPSDPWIQWKCDGFRLGETAPRFRVQLRRSVGPTVEEIASLGGMHWVDFLTSVSAEPMIRLPVHPAVTP